MLIFQLDKEWLDWRIQNRRPHLPKRKHSVTANTNEIMYFISQFDSHVTLSQQAARFLKFDINIRRRKTSITAPVLLSNSHDKHASMRGSNYYHLVFRARHSSSSPLLSSLRRPALLVRRQSNLSDISKTHSSAVPSPRGDVLPQIFFGEVKNARANPMKPAAREPERLS
jgi:hypothetical protein